MKRKIRKYAYAFISSTYDEESNVATVKISNPEFGEFTASATAEEKVSEIFLGTVAEMKAYVQLLTCAKGHSKSKHGKAKLDEQIAEMQHNIDTAIEKRQSMLDKIKDKTL